MTTLLQLSHYNPGALAKKCKAEWDLQEDEISIEEVSEASSPRGHLCPRTKEPDRWNYKWSPPWRWCA